MTDVIKRAEFSANVETAGSTGTPIVEMRGIKKAFGAVQAVAHADLKLYPGEIHALVGGNGSGKSTLVSVLSGANAADAGVIYMNGVQIAIDKPRTALDLGIETIYQNLNLFDMLDVTSNLFAGRELLKPPPLSWLRWLDTRKMRLKAMEELKRLKINIPSIDSAVVRMSGGQRQGIACARAMMNEAPKVLIMDEPTAALGVSESKEVYRLMQACRDEGAAILFISHDMVEVMELSSQITVMRLGETITQLDTRETNRKEIVGLITGAVETWEVTGRK
jgi:D-xylose transport system ATP-binding protein